MMRAESDAHNTRKARDSMGTTSENPGSQPVAESVKTIRERKERQRAQRERRQRQQEEADEWQT